MSFLLELRESVIDDVLEIRAWHEEQRPGLGDEFVAEFRISLTRLRGNPAVYALCYREFRHLLIKRFPYGIYFRIEGEKVVVYRAHHSARSVARLRESLRGFQP